MRTADSLWEGLEGRFGGSWLGELLAIDVSGSSSSRNVDQSTKPSIVYMRCIGPYAIGVLITKFRRVVPILGGHFPSSRLKGGISLARAAKIKVLLAVLAGFIASGMENSFQDDFFISGEGACL